MAALAPANTPLLIQLPNGALVPASGLVNPGNAPQIAGAELNDAGQIDPSVSGANAQGALAAAATNPNNVIAMRGGKGGAANGALISHPSQPAVIGAEGDSGGPDINAIIANLAKAAGATAGTQTQDDTPTPTATITDPTTGAPQATVDMPSVPIAAAQPDSSSSGGILDRLKELFNGPSTPTPPPMTASNMTGPAPAAPPQGALAASAAPPTGAPAAPLPAPSPVAPALAQVAANNNTPPNVQTAIPATAPTAPGPTSAIPASDGSPDFFTRLQNNPIAMALLTGGLGTMSAASRPGATVGGALGEGGAEGLNAVFGQRAAMAQRAIDQQKAQSETALQAAQANSANADATSKPLVAQADLDRANQDRYTWFQGTGDDGKGNQVPGVYRMNTRNDDGKPDFYPGVSVTGKAGAAGATGGKTSVFQQKVSAWTAIHPGDNAGALEYAAGHKSMSPQDLNKSAYAIADKELAAMTVQPDDPTAWTDNRVKQLRTQLEQPAPTPVPQPTPALGGKPPPNTLGLPPVKARAPGKTTWKAPDGKNYTWSANGWVPPAGQ